MIIKLDYETLERLTNTEKHIVNYINSNVDNFPNMSIVDVAEETFTSPATVSRAIKKCGLNGFSELRYSISKNKSEDIEVKNVNAILDKSLMEVTYTLEQISINYVLKVVELIKNSKRIYVFSEGLTELVADEFALKLQLIG